MAGANLVYVQHQLGHSSIQVTVDLYCHWIELAKRTNELEVDLLAVSPQNEETSCTIGCTPYEAKPEVQRINEEKWGE